MRNNVYICCANIYQKVITMTTIKFNNIPGRERVQVLHISRLFGCLQHCQVAYLNLSKSYANTQKESKQKTIGQKLKNPTGYQTQSL